jgi:uncharacterized protein (DUF1800 family)
MLRQLAKGKWDYSTAAHLLNRAGFGGPPAEIEKLAALGLEAAVAHLVDYEGIPDESANPDWAKPDPDRPASLRTMQSAPEQERREMYRDYQQEQRQHLVALRHWWLERMASGPRPFQEKMVLFWHGHFATSFEKVRDAYLMWRQNDLFRRLATGSWSEMLVEVAEDPAMLIWLDQAQSRRQHPNENFAREVMELFTLGEGHYTEKDVTEGARALTGWSYSRPLEEFMDRPYWHDHDEKVIFGKEGNFNGKDFLEMIVAQPQAARFITAKLWKYFAGDDPSGKLADVLADEFRGAGNQFKPVLRAMLLSEEFYAPSVIRNQVKSPVQWLVGSVRMLERELPPPQVCVGLTRNLGQDLFAPPNVKGWDGGVTWITTATLLARYNEAATLVQGDLSSLAGLAMNRPNGNAEKAARRLQNAHLRGTDVEKLFTQTERTDKEALIKALERRFLQSKMSAEQEATLREYLDDEESLTDAHIRSAVRLVMATPEYQLA